MRTSLKNLCSTPQLEEGLTRLLKSQFGDSVVSQPGYQSARAALAGPLNSLDCIDGRRITTGKDQQDQEALDEIAPSLSSQPLTAIFFTRTQLDTPQLWGNISLDNLMITTHNGWEYLLADLLAPASMCLPGCALALVETDNHEELVLLVRVCRSTP